MNISSHIAWRYLLHKEKDSNIAFMIKICFAGIMIGTFALMLTLIITHGFEQVIHEKMRGINAPIIMYSPGNKLDANGIAKTLRSEFGPIIKGVSANSIKQAILDDKHAQSVLFLKGINPITEPSVTVLSQKIIRPKKTDPDILQQLLTPNHIIVGYKTAQEHHLSVGQVITLLIPEPTTGKKLALQQQDVTVAGIFKVGLEEYDNNLAFIALESLNEIFDEQGADQITISLKQDPACKNGFFSNLFCKIKNLFTQHDYEQESVNRLHKRFAPMNVVSWKDLYPAIVSSLKLEKYVMFFILALITLVASMNMLSLLFMQIQHKRRDIAIFKAMGVSNKQIRAIFLKIGLTITTAASLSGLLCAGIIGYFLERYPCIQLPDVYYVSYLPARMDAEIFIIVFVATIMLGLIATWIPTRRSTQLNIAHILRQD